MGWVVVAVRQFAKGQDRIDIDEATEKLKKLGAIEVNNAFLDTSPQIGSGDNVVVISHGSNFVKIGHYLEPMFKNTKGAIILLMSCELGARTGPTSDVVMGGQDPTNTYAQRVAEAAKKPVIGARLNAYLEDIFDADLLKWIDEIKQSKHTKGRCGKWELFTPIKMDTSL